MAHAAFWSFLERSLYQLVNFAVAVLIARYLDPAQMGIVATVNAFVYVANMFVDGGMTASIVRNPTISEPEIASISGFNMLVSMVFIGLYLLIAAPLESALQMDGLAGYLRLSSLILLFNALAFVRYARVEQAMRFRLSCIVNVGALLVAGLICAILLHWGYAIWSVVGFSLSYAGLRSLGYVLVTPGVKYRLFSAEAMKTHLRFGRHLLVSSTAEAAYAQGLPVLMAAWFAPAQAGLFYQSKKLVDGPVSLLASATRRLFVPAASRMENDAERIGKLLADIIAYAVFAAVLVLGWFYIVAEMALPLVLGTHWSEAVPVFKILCIGAAAFIPFYLCLDVFKVTGDSATYKKIVIRSRITSLIAVFLGSFHSFECAVVLFSLLQIVFFVVAWQQIRPFTGRSHRIILNRLIVYGSVAVIFVYLATFSGITETLSGMFLACFFYPVAVYLAGYGFLRFDPLKPVFAYIQGKSSSDLSHSDSF